MKTRLSLVKARAVPEESTLIYPKHFSFTEAFSGKNANW